MLIYLFPAGQSDRSAFASARPGIRSGRIGSVAGAPTPSRRRRRRGRRMLAQSPALCRGQRLEPCGAEDEPAGWLATSGSRYDAPPTCCSRSSGHAAGRQSNQSAPTTATFRRRRRNVYRTAELMKRTSGASLDLAANVAAESGNGPAGGATTTCEIRCPKVGPARCCSPCLRPYSDPAQACRAHLGRKNLFASSGPRLDPRAEVAPASRPAGPFAELARNRSPRPRRRATDPLNIHIPATK